MLADPADPRLDDSACLPSALASHLPLDLVILMLGTNDIKACLHRSAFEIAAGLFKPVGPVLSSAGGVGTAYPAPQALILAPPRLIPMPPPYMQSRFGSAHAKTARFGTLYGDLADFRKVHVPDAGAVISTDGMGGLHFTAETNLALGNAIEATEHSAGPSSGQATERGPFCCGGGIGPEVRLGLSGPMHVNADGIGQRASVCPASWRPERLKGGGVPSRPDNGQEVTTQKAPKSPARSTMSKEKVAARRGVEPLFSG
jgi:hypothetical protein